MNECRCPFEPLRAMASTWIMAQPVGVPTLRGLQPVEVPAALADTVTAVEPYRTRTLDDARYWLASPLPTGIGLTVRIREPLVVEPFEGWAESASPLLLLLVWSRRMDEGYGDWCRAQIHRVGREGDDWRVVSLWSDEERTQVRALFGQ